MCEATEVEDVCRAHSERLRHHRVIVASGMRNVPRSRSLFSPHPNVSTISTNKANIQQLTGEQLMYVQNARRQQGGSRPRVISVAAT